MQSRSLAIALMLVGITGCARSLPPEVPEFKVPAMKVSEQTPPELVVTKVSPAPAINPAPAPALPKTSASPIPSAPVPSAPAAPAAKTPAPTLIGSWRVTEMSHNGQSMPMPEGMSISMTFAEGGSVSMNTSGGPGGAGANQQGSYTINANQITINIGTETKSGTVTFESNDRAILQMQEMRMVLAR